MAKAVDTGTPPANVVARDKIKELITNKAATRGGKALVEEISPTNNKLEIKRLLEEANHAYTIITRYKEPPFGGIRDLYETLQKAKIYSVLRPTEFLNVIGLNNYCISL